MKYKSTNRNHDAAPRQTADDADDVFNDNPANSSTGGVALEESSNITIPGSSTVGKDPHKGSPRMNEAAAAAAKDLKASSENVFPSDVLQQIKVDGWIHSIAHSPDSKHFAVSIWHGAENKGVAIYEALTFKRLHFLENDAMYVAGLAYSKDGTKLVTGDSNGRLRVYDTSTYDIPKEVGWGVCILDLCFSVDEKRIIVGEQGNKVTMYDASTLDIVKKRDEDGWVRSLASCTLDGSNYFVAGGDSGNLVLYDDSSLEVKKKVQTGRNIIYSLAVSPDGEQIATAHCQGSMMVYDTMTLEVMHEQKKRDGPIIIISYSPDGQSIYAGGVDGKVVVINSVTFELVREYKSNSGGIDGISNSNDGQHFVSGEKGKVITVYDATSTYRSVRERTLDGHIWLTVYSPDGKRVAVVTEEKDAVGTRTGAGGKLSVYKALTMEYICSHEQNDILSLAYSSDGKFLSAAGKFGKVMLFQASTLKVLHQFEREGLVHCLAFSPNLSQPFLAVGGGDDNNVSCFDLATFENPPFVLLTRNSCVYALAYSPDGKYLLVGDHEGVAFYDSKSKDDKAIKEHETKTWITSVAFSPDSTTAAVVVGYGDDLLVFEAAQLNIIHKHSCSDDGNDYPKVAYSPNGQYLLIKDGYMCNVLTVGRKFEPLMSPILLPATSSYYFGSMLYAGFSLCPHERDEHYNISTPAEEDESMQVAFYFSNRMVFMKMDAATLTPVEFLLELLKVNGVDWLVDKMNETNVPSHVRVTLLEKIVQEHTHDELTAAKINLSLGATLNPLQYLGFLERSRRLSELEKSVADWCQKDHLSEKCANAMLKVLLDLAKKNNATRVTNILEAGNNISTFGFQNVGTTYRMNVPEKASSLPTVLRSVFFPFKKISSGAISGGPLTTALQPRPSKSRYVQSTWDNLNTDADKRVELQISRGVIPNLGSFESLKVFTSMRTLDAFGTAALSTAIDVHWKGWASRMFLFQASLYTIWLIAFTAFCEHTKMTNAIDHDLWPTYLLGAITICGAIYFLSREYSQMIRLQMIYWNDQWNYFQLTTKILAICTVALRSSITSREVNAYFSATSLLFCYLNLFHYLRGSEGCAWIVYALLSIAISLKYFLFVVAMVLLAFAMPFRALYKGLRENDHGEDKEPTAFGNMGRSIKTTLFAGIFGYFDLDDLDETYSATTALMLMTVMLLIVSVISLNALISFIDDAFQKVLAEQKEVLTKEKANLILEMYCAFSEKKRKEDIEDAYKWITLITPVSEIEKEDENFAKATKGDVKKLKGELDGIKTELKKELDAMKGDIQTILTLVQNMSAK